MYLTPVLVARRPPRSSSVHGLAHHGRGQQTLHRDRERVESSQCLHRSPRPEKAIMTLGGAIVAIGFGIGGYGAQVESSPGLLDCFDDSPGQVWQRGRQVEGR